MTTPRRTLADALAAAGPAELSVFAQVPITAPALPALVIRPGIPYRTRQTLDRAMSAPRETWRLEVVALVAVDTVGPLDKLDELVDLVRDVVATLRPSRYLGVTRAPGELTLAGKPHHGAIVELELVD